VVWARGIGWGLTDGDGMWRPAGERKGKRRSGEARVWGGEETARLNGGREGRAVARGVTPAPGRVGQPAGANPPRGRPTGGCGRARKTEGAADTWARACGEGPARLTGGADKGKIPEKECSSF
jgi:hypothetical protein